MGVADGGGTRSTSVEPALTPRLADEVLRQRLIDQLAARWLSSLVLIEAAGGYGKSTAIAQAIRDNADDPTGLDVYHACRPLDREADNLAGRVLLAFGAAVTTTGRDLDELADLVAGQMATRAPTPVCLTLDDLHHVADGDEAIAMVTRLLRTLPTNGHLVLAGRALPKLPVSRLAAAEDLVRITADDLAFTAEELAALATQHGVDPDVLAPTAGWPVMARLAILAGGGSSLDYLFEEVVDDLDRDMRVAVAAAALGRRIDDDLLREVGTPMRVADLLSEVPLVTDLGDGIVGMHDLWIEALDRLLPRERLTEVATAVARWHRAANHYDEAIQAAAEAGAWTEAKATIMAALSEGDALLNAGRTDRWLQLFPAEMQDEPQLYLLRGTTARLAHGAGAGDLDASRALERFQQDGSPAELMAAGFEVALCAWMRGDVGRVFEMYALAVKLRDDGFAAGEPLIALGDYAVADLEGQFSRGRSILDSVDWGSAPTAIALLALRARSTVCFLLGDSIAGVKAADGLLELADTPGIELIVAAAHWQHGDPELVRGRWRDLRNPVHDNTRDDFLGRVFSAMIDASLGIAAVLDGLTELSAGRSREDAFIALATAASRVAAGDETDAAVVLEELIDSIGLDDPLCRGELRRFLPYGYVLSPRIRAALDGDDLGPKLSERRDLARLLVAARDRGLVDGRDLPSPPEVLCALPLAWSVELAALAATPGAGLAAALELADYLVEFAGLPAQEELRRLAETPGPAQPGAFAILAAVPAQPGSTISIQAAGALAVRGARVDVELLRRARVRELLALLILRRSLTTDEAIEALWPDLPAIKGRNNLRITLTFVRRLLEPDRHSGEASFHIRRRGNEIRLHRSPALEVDLWDMRERLDRGRKLERAGRVGEAMEEYQAAVGRWHAPVLQDLRDKGPTVAEVVAVDADLASAAARVAEWTLAQGTTSDAIRAAEDLLRHDPFAERAHSVLISAHLADEDLDSASAAVARLRAALEDLAVEPAPDTALVLRRFDRRRAAASVS